MLTATPIAPDETAPPASEPAFEQQARAELERMVAEAAYYLAAQRGFEPGHELDDWLTAEAQVHDQLASRR